MSFHKPKSCLIFGFPGPEEVLVNEEGIINFFHFNCSDINTKGQIRLLLAKKASFGI